MAREVYSLVGVGARTPIGLRAAPAAAALRAGIMRVGEHPFMFDGLGEPLMCTMDARLDPAVMGPSRLLALAETALREACEPLTTVTTRRVRVAVFLGLPERRPGFDERDVEAVSQGLAAIEGLPIEIERIHPTMGGHAAGISALHEAMAALEHGNIELCLFGGVDSYLHLDTIEWLGEHRQLAGPSSRGGFIPGEGAGFGLLMGARTSYRLGLPTLAQVRCAEVGRETKVIKSSAVCLGRGLEAVVHAAMAQLGPGEMINDVICDINGERYRSEEWGFVSLRGWRYFDEPGAFRSPADVWGDMGAASGPLFAMLVCQAAARGYAKGPRTMIWASSERGLRAVAVLGVESGR